MKTSTFRKSKLATSLSLVLGATIASPGFAEETKSEQQIEVIEVTGMRSSIKESTRLKRDATGVVDAISAEDIGKFPDTNLAESLQRITGVSIDRSNGEGSRVTVRGFGPQYNMVTLNGRAMPATELPFGGGRANNRAYDFQNLSSDAVKSVEVYKTGRADIATGGIGASININTAKPLDKPGLHASIGGKALFDTSVRDGVRDLNDKVTPELSGLISWTDEEEVFGASFTGSFSERHSSQTGAEVNAWRNRTFSDLDGDGDPDINREVEEAYVEGGVTYPATVYSNLPAEGTAIQLPSDIAYRLEDTQRERTNAQLTLQYRPMDNLTATLDYTYTELTQEKQISDISGWYDSFLGEVTFTSGLNPTPELYFENRNQSAPRDIALKQIARNIKTEDKSIGINLDWDVNDYFNLTLDYHDSKSESLPTEKFGNDLTVGIGSNVHAGIGARYLSSGLPVQLANFDDCDPRPSTQTGNGYNCNGVLDINDLGTTMLQTVWNENTNDIQQLRIDGSYEFDEGSIDFGIESRDMKNHTIRSHTGNQAMGGWGASNAGELPTAFLDPIDFNDSLDDYKLPSEAWTQGFRGDAKEILYWADTQYDLVTDKNPNNEVDLVIEEEIFAAYFQINLNGELGGMPYHVSAGLRHESTDSTSTSASAIPLRVRWTSNNDTLVDLSDEVSPRSVKNEYDHLLPSFDFDLNIKDDLKARFSYSKTIARPQYQQLSSAVAITGGPAEPTVLDPTATGGASSNNPNLVPLESDNLDLSLEWYFEETSYVSVGYFEKRVDNFVGSGPIRENYFDLRDASNGPRAQQAINDLANIYGITSPTNTDLFSMVAANQLGEALYANGHTDNWYEENVDVLPNSDDPQMIFLSQSPVNNNEAKIDGFELAVQHFLSDTGFGLQANYTIVNGDVKFDLASTETQFALLGLSDSANLVLMYEKDDLSARIAYNWRDDFLNDAAIDDSEPEFVEAYSQIDLSVSYQLTKELSLSFAGINVTGEDARRHGRTKNALINAYESEARYEFGARYTF
ncbi:TonB-dependent receptor [Thalassotalea agariperforans]